jgi:hypothetical protein
MTKKMKESRMKESEVVRETDVPGDGSGSGQKKKALYDALLRKCSLLSFVSNLY